MSDYSDRLAEPDADLREALLRRYGRVRPDGFWQRLHLQGKRLVWKAVVVSAYVFKRLLDIVAASILLILLTPLFLTIMLLIRLESPGPIFFRQVRVGRWGALFTMWKFRSMYVDAEARKAALLAENESGGGVIFTCFTSALWKSSATRSSGTPVIS